MLAVMLGGPAPLWREREIRARHTRVRRGEEGRLLPVIRRHVAGLWLQRADEPYAGPVVLWEAPERMIDIPPPRRPAAIPTPPTAPTPAPAPADTKGSATPPADPLPL